MRGTAMKNKVYMLETEDGETVGYWRDKGKAEAYATNFNGMTVIELDPPDDEFGNGACEDDTQDN